MDKNQVHHLKKAQKSSVKTERLSECFTAFPA
jgi:hypothetical protein